MRKFLSVCLCVCLLASPGVADVLSEAKDLYDSTYMVCAGIADELSKVSGVAKGGVAIGAAGTVASGGALTVGIIKANLDKKIEGLVEKMCALGGCDADGLKNMSDTDFYNNVMVSMADISDAIMRATEQSKNLGNWRTALMAGTIVTNAASAILAGVNRDQTELIQHIQACNSAIDALVPYKNRLIASGVSPLQEPVIKKIDAVSTWCRPINVADVEKIEKRMGAVMGIGIAGTVVGVAGTTTSALANSEKIRSDDSVAGKAKEKKLNTASNVLAGVNVVTGVAETGLNISLITLSKKLIQQAEQCEGVF